MRRVMTLALLALALPTAALANGITFNASSDTNAIGVVFFVFVPGSTYTIEISGGATFLGQDLWALSGGTVTVTDTSTGATVFQNSLGTGLGDTFAGFSGFGSLEPNSSVSSGSYSFGTLGGVGSATVRVTFVPEPSALEGLLLGTGMLGLVEMTRRKLRLGT